MTTLEAGIVSADAASLAAFYREALGFVVESERSYPQGTVIRLRRGRAGLKIFQPGGGASAASPPEPWHRDAGFAYAALHVDDATAETERFRAGGGTVLTGPTNHRPGAWFALVRDPQGNTWELLQEDDG